jgi:hypothetical protein
MKDKVERSISKIGSFKKNLHQYIKYPRGYKNIILILGCQRSGTTLISNIFSRIEYVRVFGEFSKLTNQDKGKIRLNAYEDVTKKLDNCHAPLIVLKPLVESQNANRLLKKIPRSSILWIYRHYKDVALSDINKFRKNSGRGNILPFVNDEQGNWRNENSSEASSEIVKKIYKENLSSIELACLFWYLRNIMYFEQNLDKATNVTLWKYEEFVNTPTKLLNNLLNNLDLAEQHKDLTQHIYSSSINLSSEIGIHPEIEKLCEDLYSKLNTHFKLKQI